MNDHASELALALEPAEAAILARIELDMRKIRSDNAQANGSAVVELMRLLVKRGAIPDVRAK
jgi:hypothetical protein